jgi:hypothetical protein
LRKRFSRRQKIVTDGVKELIAHRDGTTAKELSWAARDDRFRVLSGALSLALPSSTGALTSHERRVAELHWVNHDGGSLGGEYNPWGRR